MTVEGLISIIVPVYNAEKTLDRCIKSILLQTYNNFELLLIDDGSVDKSYKKCNEYLKRDKRVRVFHQENKGVSAARNVGIANAKGDFFAFVDPDDYIKNTYLEYLYGLICKWDAEVSICPYVFVNDEGEKISTLTSNSEEMTENKVYSQVDVYRELLKFKGDFCGHVWDKLFKREVVEGNIFPENVDCFEDLLFCWKCIYKANKIIMGRENQYYYVQHEASILNRKYSKKYFSSFMALDALKTDILKSNNHDVLREYEKRYRAELLLQGTRCIRTLSKKEQVEFAEAFLGKFQMYNRKKSLSYKQHLKWIYLRLHFKGIFLINNTRRIARKR